MLRRLDPFSIFFDPGQFEQLNELQKSTRKGFGSVVSILPGRVIVLQTLPGTPSAKSGMSPGDEIVVVNGIPLARLDTDQLVQLLSQSRNQQVRLDVRRPGNARLLPLVLTPEEVDSPSVERAFLMRPGVAYLRVGSFDVPTGKAIKDAIEQLGGENLKGLVLDLRNNPGGVVASALETASLFLKPGQVIVSVRGRSVGSDEVKVPDGRRSVSVSGSRPDQRQDGERVRNCYWRPAGSQARNDFGRAKFRQRACTERHAAVSGYGGRVDHGVLFHSGRSVDSTILARATGSVDYLGWNRRVNARSSRRSRGDDAIARRFGCHGLVYYVRD